MTASGIPEPITNPLEELRRRYAPDVEMDVSQLTPRELDHFLQLIHRSLLAEVRQEVRIRSTAPEYAGRRGG